METFDDVAERSRATRVEIVAPRPSRRARVPIMALGGLALVGALIGGLVRIGWVFPVPAPLVAFHGPLMVAGFLGTVIGLERAVALGRSWAYVAPLASGLGALALMVGAPGAAWSMLLGSAVMVLVFVEILGRQATLFTVVMALGAVSWSIGQILWLADAPMHRVIFWWAGFVVLTIAGERLELTRLLRRGMLSCAAFVLIVAVLLVGLGSTMSAPEAGVRAIGVAFIALAVWLGVFDMARRTVRMSGLPRFTAVALLSGYVWLAVSGLFAVRWGDVAAGPQYDAILHTVFVGFAFSMIFGHAPIIVPAVVGRGVTYQPRFYVHLGLLHASLALRILGDLAPWPTGRQWGGLVNVLAVVFFLTNTVTAMVRPGHHIIEPDPCHH